MSNRLIFIDRFIIVRNGVTESRIPISNCFWCAPAGEAICALCHARAQAYRALREKMADG